MRAVIALAMMLSGALPALADTTPAPENQQIAGLSRTPLMLPVTLANDKPALLEAFVTRPANNDPAPVALITNGTADTADFDRFVMNPNRYASTAIAFARHAMRRWCCCARGMGSRAGRRSMRADRARSRIINWQVSAIATLCWRR